MKELAGQDPDSIARVRARRLRQISALVFAGLLVATTGYVLERNWSIVWLLLPGMGLMLLCLWLSQRGRTDAANLIFLFSLTSVVCALTWVSEGIKDVALLSFPALLIMAGLLVSTRAFFVLLGSMVAYLVFLTLATEFLHWRRTGYVSPPYEQLRDVLTILVVSGLAIWLILSDLQKALASLQLQITRYRESQAQLTYLSQHDSLTGLANRSLGRERLERAIAVARRQHRRVAVLFVDLDNFKVINDSLGHAAGDDFLKQVATRLNQTLRKADIVARHGGDEFVIGLSDVNSAEDASGVATSVLLRMEESFMLKDTEVSTSCSIGIALFPDDGDDYETLMRQADVAMYRAKESGRNAFRFFDAAMQADLQHNLQLVANLRIALARAEFVLHYQPVFDLHSGVLVGAEALIRWQHPEQGLLMPGHFIAAAEKAGVIVEMGEWVLVQACQQAAQWQRAGAPLVLAVNLSPVQFRRGNVEQVVEDALRRSGLPGSCLELEITESTLIEDTERFVVSLQRLKALGVSIAIDDFGTGYSNLGYLQRFAVHKLKIDQSFVKGMLDSEPQHAMVAAIVQMAKGLHLVSHAEGIEEERIRDALRALGCEQGQGYWFARPEPAEAFGRRLAPANGA
nr:EAL domain-containing protein [uncultured Rhodoferax sp.]